MFLSAEVNGRLQNEAPNETIVDKTYLFELYYKILIVYNANN